MIRADMDFQELDARLMLLAGLDNVVVAREQIEAGEAFKLEDGMCTASETILVGFKVARYAIASGDKILKYGAPIGSATCNIAAGIPVHTDNMTSDYLPTYTSENGGRYTQRAKD